MQPIVPVDEKKSGVYQGPPIHSDPQSAPPVNLIRTMKSDAETAIKNQNETAVSIALAEQKKREEAQRAILAAKAEQLAAQTQKAPPQTPGSPMSPVPLPKAPKKIGRFVFLLIVLMILSLLGLAYIFLLPQLGRVKLPSVSLPSFPKESKLSSTSTPVVPKRHEAVASSTPSEKRFNIAGASLAQITTMVASEKSKGTLAGSLKNLIFTEGEGQAIISASRLLSFTNAQAPDMLTRSLDNKITVGFFGETNGGASPFIILKVTAHDTSLAGMLDWEDSLPRYFDAFFGTTIKKDPRTSLRFHDLVILKKDTRVLEVPFGGTLGYAFANENTIVIAGSRTALEALLPLAEKN